MLKDALQEIFEGVEGLKLNESPPVASPELLFHARIGLEERLKAEQGKAHTNKAVIDDLNVALQYIAEDYDSTLETLASLSSHYEITFNLLWTLFPPNTEIFTKHNLLREDQVLKLQTGEYGARANGSRYFSLNVRHISHDGEKFGWIQETSMQIDQFEGAKKVHHLKCFPLSHHPDQDDIRTKLIQRGRRYVELLQPTYLEYTGAAITENREVVIEGEYKQVLIHVSITLALRESCN